MYNSVANVAGAPHSLAGVAHAESYTKLVLYLCTLYVYKPTVQPVTGHSLFLDVQVVTLLLGEYILFARSNLYYPTTRPRSYLWQLTCVYTYDRM